VDTLDLFTARRGGYYSYRIPGIITAPNGDLLAYCEARLGSGGDWDLIDIQMRRSRDNGLSWEPAQTLLDHQEFEGGGLNNCVMIADRVTNEVHTLFCRGYSAVYQMHSGDNGRSFSDPVEITDLFVPYREEFPWQVVALGPGHGIQLHSGRLIVPLWLALGVGSNRHQPSIVTLIYSDDHGESWQRGPIVAWHDGRRVCPSETVAVELSNGHLLLNLRNQSPECRRLVATSADGGKTWTTPVYDEALLEPKCMGSIVGLDGAVVFANPDNLEQTLPGAQGRSYDRKRLTIQLSEDDCRSWAYKRVIEAGPAAYSDLATTADGRIICFLERGYMDRHTSPQYLTAARLDLAWIKENNADD
jgi:sialidase-1